jgi:hypothetical protein
MVDEKCAFQRRVNGGIASQVALLHSSPCVLSTSSSLHLPTVSLSSESDGVAVLQHVALLPLRFYDHVRQSTQTGISRSSSCFDGLE